jgi:hypothetical protein
VTASTPATSPSPVPAAPRRAWWRRLTASRWFVVVGGVWLVAIAGSAMYGLSHPSPTVREETTVAGARPVVDQAIARVASAVAADGSAVLAVSSFDPIGACDVTVFRTGGRYQRALVAVVAPGTEADLLSRVARALPVSYHAAVTGRAAPRLSADAGYWVLLSGSVSAPGEVRFVADTGDCRALGNLDARDPTPAVPLTVVPDVLARLHLPGGNSSTASVSCVDGGALATIEADGPAYSGDLTTALGDPPAGATVVVDEPSLIAYRTATAQVAVRAHQDATLITASTVCSG